MIRKLKTRSYNSTILIMQSLKFRRARSFYKSYINRNKSLIKNSGFLKDQDPRVPMISLMLNTLTRLAYSIWLLYKVLREQQPITNKACWDSKTIWITPRISISCHWWILISREISMLYLKSFNKWSMIKIIKLR